MAWAHYLVECARLFANPSSVGCLLGGIHFLLARSAWVSLSRLPPRITLPAGLSRCVVYGGHYWRRKMWGSRTVPYAREGSSRPSPPRAAQARGAPNRSRSSLRRCARSARLGSSRAGHRSPRRPPLRPPGLALARSCWSSQQLPKTVRSGQGRTNEGCCPEPRKPPKLVLDAEGRHYATTQGHDARRHKPSEIVHIACSYDARHHAVCLFNAASTASSAVARPQPKICCAFRSPEPGAGGHTPSPHSFRKSTSSSRRALMLAGSGPASGCGPSVSSRPSTTRAVYSPRVKHRSICIVVCGFSGPFTTTA